VTGQTVPVNRPLMQRIDLFALLGAGLALLVTVFYVFLVYAQGDSPSSYAVGILLVAIACAAYAVPMRARGRTVTLGVAAIFLFLLGFIALFSIGLPLVLAAMLCVLGAMRRTTRDWRDTV
jgi:membrane-bound metal-dependent hydrolase YbcI (DUF457 family)